MEANEMGSLPVGRLLRKMSMPLIFSMLVQVLYGLVDSLYVARLGDNALTAISLCMPVQFLVLGVGTGIGVGVNSVLSKKLGEKDAGGVNRSAGNGFTLVWIVTVVFVVLGFVAVEPFYQIQTDITDILDMCIAYSEVLLWFSFAALHQIMMERLLSSIGRADLTMIPMLTGAVVNIILDPIMIFGWLGCPAMGIAGAGIATVTAQAVAALTGLVLNLRFNREVKVSGRDFILKAEIVAEIIKIGVPVALSQCLLAIAALGMNAILLGLSALAPGVYVIFLRLQSFIIMPSSGMSSAGISIIAYNYGAKEKDRIMGTLWSSLRVNLVIAVVGLVVFMIFPRQLLLMFNASEEMMGIGIPALRFVAAAFLFTTTTQILSGFLQAMGQGTASFIVATAQTAFMVLFAWLLAQTGSATLVWLAFPLMEVTRFVIAVIMVKRTYRGKIANLQTMQEG
ncbi:MAG: MATE family efflux transporter [Lachnospiraceae bacterium]|nr:MATE family efflux transporter [Lachnospiraceae bacterium]